MGDITHFDQPLMTTTAFAPIMTPAAFSAAIGLEETVFRAQFERGYWGAPIRIGKRVFVNVEAVRLKCAERAKEFAL